MKIVISFRLAKPADNELAADCWSSFSRFGIRDGRTREYQIEADQPDDQRVSLVDVITDVTGDLHDVIQRYDNTVALIVGVHAVRGD
jgi:hypothetical protein